MDRATLDSWLARITYKAGWTLKAEPYWADGQGFCRITVGYLGADSCKPDAARMFHHNVIVREQEIDRFEWFADFCLQAFHELENHETREWFRVDGRPWALPHDPKAVVEGFRNSGARYDKPPERVQDAG